MEKINLCEGVVAQMMDTEAWSNISGNFPFSEAQLEKFTGLRLQGLTSLDGTGRTEREKDQEADLPMLKLILETKTARSGHQPRCCLFYGHLSRKV